MSYNLCEDLRESPRGQDPMLEKQPWWEGSAREIPKKQEAPWSGARIYPGSSSSGDKPPSLASQAPTQSPTNVSGSAS